MKDLTTSDKAVLERLIYDEFHRLYKANLEIDNSNYYKLIEMAQKLYLRNEFIDKLKIDMNEPF